MRRLGFDGACSASLMLPRHPRRARRTLMQARNHSAVVDLALFEDIQRESLDRHVIQWYPGHIAKAERQLKGQLNKVDIVFDVRDARIIQSTMHPQMIQWTASKRRFLLVNRIDMVSKGDLSRWKRHFSNTDERVFYTNGQSGTGIEAVIRASEKLSTEINANRTRRGLKPRAVRACIVGFPNIGKSALINRLLHRRVVMSAAMPGVIRVLRWVRMGESLDLLDSPGIMPGSICDQKTAVKLAICNDIGEASYVHSAVAAAFLSLLPGLPGSGQIIQRLEARYNRKLGQGTSEDFVWHLADSLFQGDPEQAGRRILKDYRDLRLGPFSLETPS